MTKSLRLIGAAIIAALSIALATPPAIAQSACPYIAYGAVLTAGQWNQCFANKQDNIGYVPVNKAGDVMLGKLTMLQSTVSGVGINLPQGAAPTSPNNGDLWTTISGIFVRINGFTIGPLAGANATAFAATAPITVTFPSNVVTYAFDYAHAGTFTATQIINLNAASNPASISGTGLTVAAADATVGRIQIDSFGAVSAFTGAVYGGTAAAPTAVTSGTQLTGINAYAYNGASLVGPIASFRTYAAENIASGHQGSKACISTTPTSSTTLADGICQQNDAGITIGSPTSGSQGVGTLNATGLYINGVAVTSAGITALTGDGTATGPGSVALTLATVNINTGSWGSATQAPQFTVNGKGLITAAANVTITPAVGSITGLGTGVATALGVNIGTAGSFVVNGGGLGTPSSGVATNLTGTASGLTAGNVTTNANLTGVITSVGNATSIASQTGTGTKFVVDTAPTIAGLTVTGSFTATGLVTNADLATMVTNTVKGNATSGSASPTDLAVGSCSSASSALIWTTNTGFGCNTSITAAAVPASGLTGTTLASGVVTSSLTTVGTLAAGSVTTGFTINAGSVTWSGQVPGANVVPVANASGSPSATFGVMKADGTTIQCTSGTCSAVGGVATAITVGTTAVNSGTNNYVLTAGTGTLANVTIASLLTQGNGILVTGTTNATIANDIGTNSNLWSATSNKIVDAATLTGAGAKTALTDGATIAFDENTGVNFSLLFTTHGGSRTLSNPTNGHEGRSGCIWVTQDATGGEGLVVGTLWETAGSSGLTLSTGANQTDLVCYWMIDSTHGFITVSGLNVAH